METYLIEIIEVTANACALQEIFLVRQCVQHAGLVRPVSSVRAVIVINVSALIATDFRIEAMMRFVEVRRLRLVVCLSAQLDYHGRSLPAIRKSEINNLWCFGFCFYFYSSFRVSGN